MLLLFKAELIPLTTLVVVGVVLFAFVFSVVVVLVVVDGEKVSKSKGAEGVVEENVVNNPKYRYWVLMSDHCISAEIHFDDAQRMQHDCDQFITKTKSMLIFFKKNDIPKKKKSDLAVLDVEKRFKEYVLETIPVINNHIDAYRRKHSPAIPDASQEVLEICRGNSLEDIRNKLIEFHTLTKEIRCWIVPADIVPEDDEDDEDDD